jgi:hypothetical protein
MPKTVIRLLAILFISFSSINAQTVISKYAGEFMAIGIGGRPLGMGGAFVAIANDVTAGYYNPAGLGNLNYPQISLMHSEQFGNLVNYDYAAVGIPFGSDMSFGISAMRLAVDGIPDTREALEDGRNPGITIYDPNFINDDYARLNYSKIKEFTNQDWAFYLTFAKRHSDNFYWGANIKIIRRDIAEFGATGIGFDVGAYYTPIENLHLGANVQETN